MKKIKVAEYNLINKKIPAEFDGCSFVMIADFHNNDYGIDTEAALRKIDRINPDFVIIAGDMVVARPGTDNTSAFEFINRLAKKRTVYYGNGNHEYRMKIYQDTYGSMYDEFLEKIKNPNIIHLVNDLAQIKKGGSSITVKGLEIDRRFYKRFHNVIMTTDYLKEEIGSSDNAHFEILIAHNPKYFKTYAEYGSDLILSGHVHGGLVRLPLLGGVVSPDIRLFPKYDYGSFSYNDSTMILTSGMGAHTLKLRMFNPPEIVVVNLKRDNRWKLCGGRYDT